MPEIFIFPNTGICCPDAFRRRKLDGRSGGQLSFVQYHDGRIVTSAPVSNRKHNESVCNCALSAASLLARALYLVDVDEVDVDIGIWQGR